MKKLLLVLGAASMVACMHDRDNNGAYNNGGTMNEPAGAQTTNSMNSMNSMPARDINQQPYPGQSDLNQRGTSSDNNLLDSSGNSSRSGSTSSGAAHQNP
jgi:hypothetical protein